MEKEELSKSLDELFTRVRKLEIELAEKKVMDSVVLDKIEELKKIFETHDQKEMEKYKKIEEQMKLFNKKSEDWLVWIVKEVGKLLIMGAVGGYMALKTGLIKG